MTCQKFLTRTVLAGVLVFLVMSCSSNDYSGLTTRDVIQCKKVCQQRVTSCSQTCKNNCVRCGAYADHKTAANYAHYVQTQAIQGEKPVRRLNSYRDPLQCRKTTCNCVADYEVCTQSCSGRIHKQLLVPPVCR